MEVEEVPAVENAAPGTTEPATSFGERITNHPALDVPLEDVSRAIKAHQSFTTNAHKFDERGFRIMTTKEQAFTPGFDMTSEEEKQKRAARAAKWGIEAPTAPEPAALAKESMDDHAAALANTVEARQTRAARFGVPLNDEVKAQQEQEQKVEQVKKAGFVDQILQRMPRRRKALLKLDEADQRIDPAPEVERRVGALHLYGYMPLGTGDFTEFYRDYNVTTVEWINGASLNVVFADAYWAEKALQMTSEPLPPVPIKVRAEVKPAAAVPAATEGSGGGDAVDGGGGAEAAEDGAAMEGQEEEVELDLASSGWRMCADMVKKHSDKYGKKGEVGKLLVRYATVEDLKIFKPRPEREERRPRQKKRRSRGDEMDMDDDGGDKVHNLIIRSDSNGKRVKRGNRQRSGGGGGGGGGGSGIQGAEGGGEQIQGDARALLASKRSAAASVEAATTAASGETAAAATAAALETAGVVEDGMDEEEEV